MARRDDEELLGTHLEYLVSDETRAAEMREILTEIMARRRSTFTPEEELVVASLGFKTLQEIVVSAGAGMTTKEIQTRIRTAPRS